MFHNFYMGYNKRKCEVVTFSSLYSCLLYTSDAADERSSVDLGGRRIIKKKNSAAITLLRQNINTKQ